jgi:hypothetical protein
MKKLMVALLALVALSSMAYAQQPAIGVFANEGGPEACDLTLPNLVPTSIYVMAILPESIPAITAAEFRIENLLEDPACVSLTQTWNTDLVIGNANWGIALAFSPPLAGPLALLGTLTYLQFVEGCVGDDFVMVVMESNDSGNLVVVDTDYNEIDAAGFMFTFNCTGVCFCEEASAAQSTNWGSVKALF